MVYPIIAYGDPVLKQAAADIDKNYPGLDDLIKDMFKTAENANGVGLAAPQIGKSIRLFIVDTTMVKDEDTDQPIEDGIRTAFINPIIHEFRGDEYAYNEGCLSIPDIREDVNRPEAIDLEYYDEHFVKQRHTFDGINARVIQHEYDHIEGVLFTDRLKPLKKQLLKRRLEAISKGKIAVGYKMKFPLKK